MKHHVKERPIGKCKGCCLNGRMFCAAGLEPKGRWSQGRCHRRHDGSLLERFYRPMPLTGAKASHQARRVAAARNGPVPHHDGRMLVPMRLGGTVR